MNKRIKKRILYQSKGYDLADISFRVWKTDICNRPRLRRILIEKKRHVNDL